MKAAGRKLERSLELARRLGPLVSRGVLQHFFVSPLLPLGAMNHSEIKEAWSRLADQIRTDSCPELLTLYLHIPFCSHKCKYCIYHSVGDFEQAALEGYLDRLEAEIDYYSPVFRDIGFATCYLGGGTPTVLSESQLEKLLQKLDRAFQRKRGGEWAFECNPLSLTGAKARLFEEHGFNRVSFGVQTLNSRVLEKVNRGYQSDQSIAKAFRVLADCRFWINVDLIYGLPGDSLESMKLSLKKILEFGPNQVTIYALSPYTPMAGDRDQVLPLARLAEALEPVAGEFGRQIGIHSTCLDVSGLELSRDRLTEEHRTAGVEYAYDDTTVEPFSLLGLGPSARSYVYGQLTYVFDSYPADSPFDPQAACARGRALDMDEERRRYVAHRLVTPTGLDPAGFKRRFGRTLNQVFGKQIRALKSLDMLREEDGRLVHASADEYERFATELFFVSKPMIEAAGQKAEGKDDSPGSDESAAATGLRLEASGAEVRVVLADYWPGRACFHHAGRFAFFTPQTGQLGPLEERLLNAFSRLFDRIIEEHRPDTIEALRAALFARGRKLRLSVKKGERSEQIPVRLAGFD